MVGCILQARSDHNLAHFCQDVNGRNQRTSCVEWWSILYMRARCEVIIIIAAIIFFRAGRRRPGDGENNEMRNIRTMPVVRSDSLFRPVTKLITTRSRTWAVGTNVIVPGICPFHLNTLRFFHYGVCRTAVCECSRPLLGAVSSKCQQRVMCSRWVCQFRLRSAQR